MHLEVNGTNLYYEKLGQGKPLIMLHGNGEDSRIFDAVKDKLAERFCVYLIDSRGHGKSDKVDELSYEVMAEDIREFIEKLRLDLYDPILYGFSDGGIIGLLLTIKYPFLLSKLIVSGPNTSPDAIKTGNKLLLKAAHFFSKSQKLKLMLEGPDIKKEELSSIKIPVLVTAGEKEFAKMENLEFIANNIPNSRLKILPGETHSSYVVKSTKLLDVIIPFVCLLAFD